VTLDRDRVALVIERRRALAAAIASAASIGALADKLRSFFYPKQRDFFRSKAKRRATKKTRRSGATSGGCRELLARSIEQPGHRATYITGTLKDARKRAWESDTKSGFVDVIRKYGTRIDDASIESYDLAGVVARINKADLVIDFSNGSQIDMFGADNKGMSDRLRGLVKHVYWIDEAQDLLELADFYKGVIVPASDFGGECWLTGTPGKDLVGMFYAVTTDDEDPLKGWEVHRIAATDNPFFGCVVWKLGQWYVVDNLGAETGPYEDEGAAETAAREIRWERSAGEAIRDNGWAEDDPDLLREYFARWVKNDARFVYAFHSVPEHKLCYAPVRLGVDGFPDIRLALADLPGRAELRQYFTALGADLGTRAAFAFVLWAWSLRDPVLYEVCSWKKPGLDYDEMAGHLHAVRAQVNVSLIVADAGGGGKPAVMGWSKKWVDRYHLPIEEAQKQNKRIAQNHLNSDIRKALVQFREDSVIVHEGRVHRWKPLRTDDGKEVEDSTPHDALDAGLYGHRHSLHHRFRPEANKILPGTDAWVLKEERELEQANCEQDDSGPYGGYGAYR
jgi:hypothetical protein